MSPLRQRMVPIPAVRVPCPAAQRRGHGQRGRLLFGDWSLATQETSYCAAGRTFRHPPLAKACRHSSSGIHPLRNTPTMATISKRGKSQPRHGRYLGRYR